MFPENKILERTSMNSWDDQNVRDALAVGAAQGRKKIVVSGLWTEVCNTTFALSCLHDTDYEIYMVADASGATSSDAQKYAMDRMVQAGIVPDGDKLLLNRPSVDAYALINQAREVGGDFYDALPLDDDHIYIAIGDVSGKGMPAALLMMRTFTSLRLLAGNDPGFEGVIPSVNNMLAGNNDDMMFVTIFAGVLNVRTGVFRYVNAGHNPPFISLGGGEYRLMDLPADTVVGIVGQSQFCISELRLNPGDSLLLYTDGIPEATNSQKIMFETDRMEKALNGKPHTSMKSVVQSLEKAVGAFVGNAKQHDDLTIMGFRYLGYRFGGNL